MMNGLMRLCPCEYYLLNTYLTPRAGTILSVRGAGAICVGKDTTVWLLSCHFTALRPAPVLAATRRCRLLLRTADERRVRTARLVSCSILRQFIWSTFASARSLPSARLAQAMSWQQRLRSH
eukprot:6193707-Pleurochrysis_carterae.AAC.2